MKVKLLVALFFLTIHFSFSQTEKLIIGKVTSDGFELQNVDVINKNAETSTTTNFTGDFQLSAKVGDSILFYKKEYYLKGILLRLNHFSSNAVAVQLVKKAEELDEVIIKKVQIIDFKTNSNYEQIKRDEITADRNERKLKNTRIDDLTIDKGLDLARIGKTLINLVTKEKPIKKIVKVDFKELAIKICDQNFFLKTLQLNPDEIELFLQYCNADPKSTKLLENTNVLSMMDFLISKNIEFKKL